ncbi:RraA family protein [Neobacillus notoginsengisoli]|uniref:Putative 4-hydroxy-4-methyl-2-oxoglutarate aldolase n=1 Tax=Neobacillus notoginsengisoli TaxID=1578198 RepID=A0A417YUR2_9BACI|nr:RraA family protein [Neobacillus notoginsengisoli]RHW40999.1 RraA family protein [Neobacillus notoginsengisoli]
MEDIVMKFRDIPTTCVSDVMDGLYNLHSSIKPLKEDYKLAGRAFTVKTPVGDNLAVFKAIREAKPGDILVIDAKGDEYRAMAGDYVVGMAKKIGIAGFVLDGAIRDIVGVKELDLPVFCKATTVASSKKAGFGVLNVPISCGGMTVQPGDIVVGDADGVVVIPQIIEQEILEKSLKKFQEDKETEAIISGDREAIIKHLDQLLGK